MTLDQQCQAARDRIAQFVNRSAAQHMRAWRERWQPTRTVYVADHADDAINFHSVRVGLLDLQRMLGRPISTPHHLTPADSEIQWTRSCH